MGRLSASRKFLTGQGLAPKIRRGVRQEQMGGTGKEVIGTPRRTMGGGNLQKTSERREEYGGGKN